MSDPRMTVHDAFAGLIDGASDADLPTRLRVAVTMPDGTEGPYLNVAFAVTADGAIEVNLQASEIMTLAPVASNTVSVVASLRSRASLTPTSEPRRRKALP